jgi:molybdopterin molybdotransferase
MVEVGEALARVLAELPALEGEMVALPASRGRVLRQEVRSPRDVPPFRNSAMDGFAVRAADIAGASSDRPAVLAVAETVAAGSVARRPLEAGRAIRIMTGAPVPDGADTVVRVEDTDPGDDAVAVRVAVPEGANVRHPGEDVRRGDVVLEPGRAIRPADIGVLASIGVAVLRVARRPRVAIIATGDELVELGQPLGPGQIVNSNAYTLAAAVEDLGGEAVVLGIVPDRPEALRSAFARGLRADILLSTGGVSVGNFDFVRTILAELGYRESFWKVAQKPGKPLSFGHCGQTPVFGLPGNPVSALVCFYVYVAPAIRAMMGSRDVHLPIVAATLAAEVSSVESLTEFVRCVLEGPLDDLRARSTGSQSSGVLRSLSIGDGLVICGKGTSALAAGAVVPVMLLQAERGSAESPL